MESKNSVRIALIGTGGMGRKYANLILFGRIPGMELTAMVCRSENAREWAADTLRTLPEGSKSPRIFDSADSLFAEPDLYDAVLIVTPHKTHPELAKRAFALGKHVLSDKPAAVTAAEAEEMCVKAEENGVLFSLMFQQRFIPKHVRIRAILESGLLGRIRRVLMESTRYFRTEFYHASGTWRSSWAGEGGGLLINQGQHILDLWQYLFGMPESVFAEIPFGKYNHFDVDDEATIVMRYADGMTGTFIASTGEAGGADRLTISGSKGRLVLTGNEIELAVYSEDSDLYRRNAQVTDARDLRIVRSVEPFGQEAPMAEYIALLTNFSAAVRGEEELVSTGRSGIGSLALTNAAYLSAWKDERITLPVDGEEYAGLLAAKCLPTEM